jgi:dipeptidyl aminopeptidase/acylaminoacyl peptidase
VTTLDSSRQESTHRFPQFLPDGRHFLYFARSLQNENRGVYASSLDQPQAKRIIRADTNVAYAPPGYLLFPREGTLMAQAFDAASLELTGAPFRVAEQVGRLRTISEAYFSVSETGVLVYQSSDAGKTQLVWFDRSGKQLGAPGPLGDYGFPALSPDEKRVAIDRDDAQTGMYDIWLLDLARGIPSRFTFDPANDVYPVWSPDGSRIVFSSNRDGAGNLYQKLSSGSVSEEALLKSSDRKFPSDWSLDGRFILYNQLSPNRQWDLWVLPLFGDRQPFPFLQTKFREIGGVFSPDGKWIAYLSDESGSYQVYVQSFPPSGGQWQISSEGGSFPRFRRDGKELFYLAENGKLMAVEVKANTSGLEFSAPKPLFETHSTDRFAVTADGQRFLINTPVEESTSAPITVILNWTAEAKR